MDNTKEPISGIAGDISQGEPFDGGNLESHKQDRINKQLDPTVSAPSTSLSASDTNNGTNSEEDATLNPTGEEAQMSPDDLTGPGPRTLEEIAHENGGDAGNSSANASATSIEGGDAVDDPGSSHEKGTGEKYIKSTGLQADGGDFDATRAGAGREADRKFISTQTLLRRQNI